MPETAHQGLSAVLATHVADSDFEQLPAQTVHAAKRALLDAVGVMQAASGVAPEVRAFMDLARASGGAPEARILGTADRVPAAMAAFANGAMAHALDYEDAFDLAPLHPNAALIPAVLALAQARAPVSGRELITAIAVGCDLSCRLALSLRQRLEDGGWYPPPILGAFGAVAGAARMLKLSPRQVADAWSLLLLQNSCPGEIKYSAETVIRAVREAFPAQTAVTVTQLAEAGVRGFDAPLEGRAGFYALFAGGQYATSNLLEDLGTRWHIESLSFKPWPSCRGTHAAIEAALSLRAQPGFDPLQVEAVSIEGGPVQAMLAEPLDRKRSPQTPIDAKFSLPFTVATALVHGAVTLDRFGAAGLADKKVLALASRCQWQARADFGDAQAVAGALRIRLRDGSQRSAEVLDPAGSPTRPLSDDQLVAKFIDCLGRAARPVAAQAAATLAARLLQIDREPDVAPLF
jgi:2-methylcitrate dehydratase PrpD